MKKSEWNDGILERFKETYDFARCQRPDGTFYGTSGTCRKGVKVGAKEKAALKKAAKAGNKKAKAALEVVEGKKTAAQAKKELEIKSVPSDIKKELAALAPSKAKEKPTKDDAKVLGDRYKKSKKELGAGSYGSVKETAEGTVIKKGYIGKDEIEVQQKLAGVDGVPKLKGHAYTSEPFADRGGDRTGFVEMEKAKGKPVYSEIFNRRMDDKMDAKFATKMTDNYIGLRKQIHTRGVAHGDMHEGNLTWDGKKMGVLDFGLSRPSYKAALNEALGTFGMQSGLVGGRPSVDMRSEFFLGDMRRDGSTSARARKLESKIASIQKKAGGTITEKRAKQLIEELYDGI